MKKERHRRKEAWTLAWAMVLGLLAGLAIYYSGAQELISWIRPVGDIFIRLLKMVIIPLVFSSIFMAMATIENTKSLGPLGRRAVGYYLTTTAMATLTGLILVNLISPGVDADLSLAQPPPVADYQSGPWEAMVNVLMGAVPGNPFEAMAKGSTLQIIVLAILLGLVAVRSPKRSLPLTQLMSSLEWISLAITRGIIKYVAPAGIFALMLGVFAGSGMKAMGPMAKYMVTVLLGCFFHFLVLLTVAALSLRKGPLFVLKGVGSALVSGFATSSSAATIPITMACVEENLGVHKGTAKFVVPLGATINMDGTALYEAVAALFISQAYGIDLSVFQQFLVFATASLAAVGAAAIPQAGLVTMGIVLHAVGLPLEGIGLILSVDPLLDKFRTSLNIFGDCVGSIFVDVSTPRENNT